MKVYIENLQFKTIIGILDFERTKKQTVIVNIDFEYLYDKKTKEFVDYSLVSKEVEDIMNKKKFKLIEDAILYLKRKLIKIFNIKSLNIKITKPNIMHNCIVSVSN